MLLKHPSLVATAANKFNRTTLESSVSMGKSIKSSIQLNGQVKNTISQYFPTFQGQTRASNNKRGWWCWKWSGHRRRRAQRHCAAEQSGTGRNPVPHGQLRYVYTREMPGKILCVLEFRPDLFHASIEIYYACALWMCVERAAFNGRKCWAQNSGTWRALHWQKLAFQMNIHWPLRKCSRPIHKTAAYTAQQTRTMRFVENHRMATSQIEYKWYTIQCPQAHKLFNLLSFELWFDLSCSGHSETETIRV